jgi:hypothetical protein
LLLSNHVDVVAAVVARVQPYQNAGCFRAIDALANNRLRIAQALDEKGGRALLTMLLPLP